MARRGRRRGALPTVVLALVPLLLGCSSASDPSPPTGIDELVIPTPSIDPSDFVARVDNPWLPLALGTSWTYRVATNTVAGGVATMTVTVEPRTTLIDGVAAVVVDTIGAEGDSTDYYAQDRRGNVWWLGEQGVWAAGQDGAQAGLAMPAHPRNGDGWRLGYLPGVVEDRATVVSTVDAFAGPGGRHYRDVVDLVVTTGGTSGLTTERSYAKGVGLVRSYVVSGESRLVELVSGPVGS